MYRHNCNIFEAITLWSLRLTSQKDTSELSSDLQYENPRSDLPQQKMKDLQKKWNVLYIGALVNVRKSLWGLKEDDNHFVSRYNRNEGRENMF